MPLTEKIVKRNGQIVDFNPEKIVAAVERAFLEVKDDRMSDEARSVTNQVVRYLAMGETDKTPTVEYVQDLVERAMMERGFYDVAKAYIIYRYQHAKIREERKEEIQQQIEEKRLHVTKRSGAREPFDPEKLRKRLSYVTAGYEGVADVDAIVAQVRQEVYENIKTKDIEEVLTLVTRSFIERDTCYGHIAARLLLSHIYADAIGYPVDYAKLPELYRNAFIQTIKGEVESGKLDPAMLQFDLNDLANELKVERDDYFKYLGLQTLATNYFMKDMQTKRIREAPQMFWMRIAMGTALAEKSPADRSRWAKEFYEVMSEFQYTPSSPTLYHAGHVKAQLSSCFINTVPDDLHAIFKSYSDNAQLLKYAGGCGTDWTYIRGTGAYIKTTGVESQGVIPFIRVANDVTVSINRSGRRRGAACVYLETWHYDIEDFLELRKNTGDERRRAHDLNTANWIPDLFMKRIEADGDWTLFSPDEVPDLHDLYGKRFEDRYAEYEAMAREGKIRLCKTIKARDLWRKMLTMLFETGHPWVTFKDPSNIRSPQDHVGVVHSSNLCTEITLNNNAEETAVCNLGSVNLAKFVHDGKFDYEMCARVVPVAMRMLDNVIDVNYYPTEDTKRSNMRHRPVGLGIRGVQDALYKLGVNFDSEAAVAFADESMEAIAYHAILASSGLARERGTYQTYQGSKWDRGILPQDTIALLQGERGIPIDVARHERLDWAKVRASIREHGMRNSNTMAIAPTATTANIVGCFPTVEPIYQNLYVKSNMAGDFVVVNDFLIEDLKAERLWSRDMLDKLKYHEGSVQDIAEIPARLKEKYRTVFEIDPQWAIKAAAYRGRWIDQSQSLNIFYKGTSGKALSEIYFYAWKMGLKTTYYLRTLAATHVEKSTVDTVKMKESLGSEMPQPIGSAQTVAAMRPESSVPSNLPSDPSRIPDAIAMSIKSPISAVEAMKESPVAAAPAARSYASAAPEPSVSPRNEQSFVFSELPATPARTLMNAPTGPKVLFLGSTCESCEA